MDNFKRIIKTIGSSGLGFIANIMITLVLVPYLTDLINAEAYGWVKIAKDTVTYCTMMMLAIQDFSTRFIGISYHRGNYKEANRYYSSVFFGDTVLGLLIFTVVMIVVSSIETFFSITPELIMDVKLLMTFTMIKFLQMTVMAVFECGPVIANRMYVAGRARLFNYLTEAALLVFFYRMFEPHVYWVGLALLISSVVQTLPNYLVCRKYTSRLRVRISDFSWGAVRVLVVNGIWSSLNTINSILNSGLDLFMTNWMLSPLRMGQLAVSQSISMIYTAIYPLISPAFQPMILKAYSQDDHNGMMKWFYLSMKTCSFFCSLFFAAFVALGPAFYRLWVPNQDCDLLYGITAVMIIPAVTGGIISPFFYAYTLTVKKMIPFFFTLAGGFLNVGSMLLLLKYSNLELYAVTGTTAFFLVINHLFCNALYICHVLNESRQRFYGNVLRCLLATSIMTIIFVIAARLIKPSGWITLVLCGIVFAAAGAFVYGFVTIGRTELNKLPDMIKNRNRDSLR